ncbi:MULTISPECIES: site-specific DNA-methyltransferase [unclassified Psychrobacter]|uniref:site-specific DNA-methyltransferase n=1 Tax=unclassified Psychrobacter TaxID=196806 RepID=UPI000C2B3410|nr:MULTISPECIES: site-specific DNA-methyltransferase [unclassified Psychrobacter]MDA5133623.1 site-specific DNA-methyltransferase [Psychrobacter sp. ANT_H3]PJX24813.1 site-specific DNA-methyltransferase [Psychrobacter sp. L7]
MPILNWLNKEQALTTARDCPYRLVELVPELSYGESDTDNMLIQGDNLDALKALIPTHSGKVKCIFIDPPYNTKSAFEHYDDNLEHSKWLSMIYPRLELLHQLLSEDGSIWITLDDNESHYAKVILDEIFGRKNFISNCIWQKVYTIKNSAKYFSEMHDHCLVYAKSKDKWLINSLPRTEKQNKAYKNYDNDPRGPWKATPIQARNFYSRGLYEIKSPSGRVIDGPPKGSYWRISEESFKALEQDNRIWWGKKGDNVPAQKRFLSEIEGGVVPSTIWFYDEAGHNAESKNEVRAVFEGLEDELFITPKPERLIQRILHLATKEGDLVLDSFLGSGTTAAVALKMNRKFIGVELGEHAENQCVYRLKKVVDGEQGGISEDVNWIGGSGFKFYRLGEVIFNENGSLREGISFDALASHIWYGDTRQALQQSAKSPLLGVHNGVAYYLLYNGILGDKRPDGGNVLTSKVLSILPPHPEDPENGKKVIYGERRCMGEARLKSENIIFKQIPYDVKGR